MQIIRDPADAASIADPELRALVEKTIRDLSEDYPYDPAELGYFLLVQQGDTLAAINEQLGWDILTNRWTGIRFGDPRFTPSFELVDEHAGYFELVYVMGQDGGGIEVMVSKSIDIPDLLAMCRQYAVPAPVAM